MSAEEAVECSILILTAAAGQMLQQPNSQHLAMFTVDQNKMVFNQQQILTTTSMAWEHFSLQFQEICANCITLSGLLTFGVIDIFR